MTPVAAVHTTANSMVAAFFGTIVTLRDGSSAVQFGASPVNAIVWSPGSRRSRKTPAVPRESRATSSTSTAYPVVSKSRPVVETLTRAPVRGQLISKVTIVMSSGAISTTRDAADSIEQWEARPSRVS